MLITGNDHVLLRSLDHCVLSLPGFLMYVSTSDFTWLFMMRNHAHILVQQAFCALKNFLGLNTFFLTNHHNIKNMCFCQFVTQSPCHCLLEMREQGHSLLLNRSCLYLYKETKLICDFELISAHPESLSQNAHAFVPPSFHLSLSLLHTFMSHDTVSYPNLIYPLISCNLGPVSFATF